MLKDLAQSVESILTGFFGHGVAAAVWSEPWTPELLPDEVGLIRQANGQRRDEFRRGRAAARKALPGTVGGRRFTGAKSRP